MSIGNNGDFYIDTLNGDYYAKIAGVWVFKGNITGPQGIQGIQGVQGPQGDPGAVIITADLLFGNGPPSGGLGVDTQVYVDQLNSDVYKKISGVWVLQVNIRGAAGPPGVQGVQGIQGVPGFDGNDGEQGPPGLPGAAGAPGADGIIGRDGLQGPPGNDGIDGIDGLPGPPGASGTGAQGPQGIQGQQGPPGNDGADGDDGLPGPPGASGTGAQGPQGIQGTQGPPGNDGADGDDGLPGPPGAAGAQGATGSTGPSGGAASANSFLADKSITGSQSVTANVETKCTFPDRIYDNGGYFNTSNSRWTPPAGPIQISAGVGFAGGPYTAGACSISLYKNGVIVYTSRAMEPTASTASVTIAVQENANGTDYYEIFSTSPPGSNAFFQSSQTTWFSGHSLVGFPGTQGRPGDDGPEGPEGPPGPPGQPGAAGATGSTGAGGIISPTTTTFTFSNVTTSTNPGAGKLNFDSATIGSIANMYINNTDANSVSQSAFFAALPIADRYNRCFVHLYDTSSPPIMATFEVISYTAQSGYTQYGLRPILIPKVNAFVNSSNYTVRFSWRATDEIPISAHTNVAGKRQGFPGFQGTGSFFDLTFPANSVLIWPLQLDRPAWIDSFDFIQAANPARTAGTMRLLIYRAYQQTDGCLIPFGAPVYSGTADSTILTTNGPAFKNFTMSIALDPGLYAFMLCSNTGSGNAAQIRGLVGTFGDGAAHTNNTNIWAASLYETVNPLDLTTTAANPWSATPTETVLSLTAISAPTNPSSWTPGQFRYWYM